MAVISEIYAPQVLTDIVVGDFPLRSRTITIASGANASGSPLARGTVLGQVTATGAFIVSATAASDGSQTPKCILSTDGVDASAGTTTCEAYFTGEFGAGYLTYGAGHSASTVDGAFITSGTSIFIRETPVLG